MELATLKDKKIICGDQAHRHLLTQRYPFHNTEDVLQRLVDALQKLVDVASRIGGHVAADPVVMDTVTDAEPVGHHRSETPEADGGAGERAGGQDVVVYGAVGWVSVQAGQRLTLRVGKVMQSKQVAVKPLTCSDRRRKILHMISTYALDLHSAFQDTQRHEVSHFQVRSWGQTH